MLLTVLCLMLLATTATSQDSFGDVIANIRHTIKDIKSNCFQTEGVDENELERILMLGKYDSTNHDLKCAVKCLYVNTEIMSSTGEINEANMKTKTGTSNVDIQDAVVANCKGFTDSDLCERTYKISNCTYHTIKSGLTGRE
ncbi:hypothetical protein PPYR_02018 [Photinus pyralis]|uniref:Uncharacterized protein n=1 Tax=Photinus pyralis TaxID=7054 RepID=A0A5N4B603_PHOPY|nr:uncharacterized protein LOC116160932 [Photinus pyralis]XP_031338610.1 uncharacterized protein LOC116167394 [Photinus pyralis]KAB0805047.1 hypothetical protein PPYR_02017 [Photinus pyralis]KAB0805048.1 hypothetical protein PPYR_02018 [Photinus pyralis]